MESPAADRRGDEPEKKKWLRLPAKRSLDADDATGASSEPLSLDRIEATGAVRFGRRVHRVEVIYDDEDGDRASLVMPPPRSTGQEADGPDDDTLRPWQEDIMDAIEGRCQSARFGIPSRSFGGPGALGKSGQANGHQRDSSNPLRGLASSSKAQVRDTEGFNVNAC